MIKVKPMDQVKSKWRENGGRAADIYAQNALAAGEDWATKTQAAGDNYKAAISQSGVADRFRAGVRRAGAAKYTRKLATLGRDRYAPGIEASVDDFAVGVEPYLAAISQVTLPARKPRGDKANLARVEAVTTTLNAKRMALLGMKGAG